MALKPFPRLILIVAAVGAVGFGINALNKSGVLSSLKSNAAQTEEEPLRAYPQGVSTPRVAPINAQLATPPKQEPTAPVVQTQETQPGTTSAPMDSAAPDAGLQKLLGAGVKK